MLEQYIISEVKQLKALSHTSRVKILSALMEKAMTAKQLADHFGDEPAKTSYHVKQLLKVGLVELVYTRETQNGIVEKYYLAVAKEFQTAPYLSRQPENRSALESGFLRHLNKAQSDFLRAYREEQDQPNGASSLAYGFDSVSLSPESLYAFSEELKSLLERFQSESTQGSEYVFHYLLFPQRAGEDRPRVKERV